MLYHIMEKELKMIGVNKLLCSFVVVLAVLVPTQSKADYCEWPCFANKVEKPSRTINKRTKKTVQKNFTVRDVPVVGDVVRLFESGLASFYWQPQAVACGGRFNPNAMTAAHKTLKCGSKVRVTNKRNGKSVTVTINDRGPYVRGRVIDLSKAAAHAISMQHAGVVPVTVEVIR